MLGAKAHFAELAPAKVGLGPAGHEQVATKVADCECARATSQTSKLACSLGDCRDTDAAKRRRLSGSVRTRQSRAHGIMGKFKIPFDLTIIRMKGIKQCMA